MEAWIQQDFRDRGLLARGKADLRLMTKGFLGRPKCLWVTPFYINDDASLQRALSKLMEQAKRRGYDVDLSKRDTQT